VLFYSFYQVINKLWHSGFIGALFTSIAIPKSWTIAEISKNLGHYPPTSPLGIYRAFVLVLPTTLILILLGLVSLGIGYILTGFLHMTQRLLLKKSKSQ